MVHTNKIEFIIHYLNVSYLCMYLVYLVCIWYKHYVIKAYKNKILYLLFVMNLLGNDNFVIQYHITVVA